jgi:hypothetical protein
MSPDRVRAKAWQGLRDSPLSGNTLVVAKLAGTAWAVFPLDQGEVMYEGPFVKAWTHATELARRQRPARIVALNDEGNVIAQETIGEG